MDLSDLLVQRGDELADRVPEAALCALLLQHQLRRLTAALGAQRDPRSEDCTARAYPSPYEQGGPARAATPNPTMPT